MFLKFSFLLIFSIKFRKKFNFTFGIFFKPNLLKLSWVQDLQFIKFFSLLICFKAKIIALFLEFKGY